MLPMQIRTRGQRSDLQRTTKQLRGGALGPPVTPRSNQSEEILQARAKQHVNHPTHGHPFFQHINTPT